MLIYDKDYCTVAGSINFEEVIKRKLGNNSIVFRHNGYCIESTLFSEKEVLVNVLEKLSGKDKEAIDAFVTHYFTTIKAELMDIRSVKYNDMNAKFRSQKQEERPELAHVEFNDFLSCAFNNDSDNFQYVFNKHILVHDKN